MQLGWEPGLWFQLCPRRLLLLVVLLILVSCAWVMGIGVGMRWKRSPNHRRPQAMTMHPCPAVEAGGSPGSSFSYFASPRWGTWACERRLGWLAGCYAAMAGPYR